MRAAIASARSRSSTRRRAAVVSQAAGRSGMPSRGQVRAAASTASAERVLDEVEPTELREEQGHQPAPLLAHRRHERLVGRHCGSYPSILITGRISTVYAGGSSRAAAIAASRSGSSTS